MDVFIRTPFPVEGKVRVKQAAPFLGIAVSTFWLYVKQGRICRPMVFGPRVSVWEAAYIRDLARNGVPSADEVVAQRSQKAKEMEKRPITKPSTSCKGAGYVWGKSHDYPIR